MKIAVASDHRGFLLKEKVKACVEAWGHEAVDFGAFGQESSDYPDYGIPAARSVASGECDRGVVVCGTGIGMCIAANKVRGIRAALCHNEESARMSRQHNDANVLCLGANDLTGNAMERIVRVWLTEQFEGGRHARRVGKIMEVEK